MAQRILDDIPPAQRGPLVIRELQEDGTSIRDRRNGSGFVPLGSTGQLTVITDTIGRSARAYLVAEAERYVELSGRRSRPSNSRSQPSTNSYAASCSRIN